MRAARPLLLAAALALSLVGLGAGARGLALKRAERVLADQGATWQGRQTTPLSARWRGVQAPGLVAEEVQVALRPRPEVVIRQARVDLEEALGAARGGGASAGEGGPVGLPGLPVDVRVEGLSLHWRGRELAAGLSGTLRPEVALSGPDAALSQVGGRWQARLSRDLDLGLLRARAEVTLTEGDGALSLHLRAPDAVLAHPLLAARPLPPQPLAVELSWAPGDGRVEGTVALGEVRAGVQGRLQPDPPEADLDLSLVAVPLTDVIALFGDQVPEARHADCEGTLGLRLHVAGPPLAWKALPSAEGLTCTGLVGDLDALRSGTVTWRARGADGSPVLARTGPGQPGFTPWEEGRRVAEAFIASEDIGFPTHGGYDLSAIQEALDEAAAGDARPRGGSTLTQQLAKNLYLDGERTLARKLRELLYALDLEASLDKRHLLQLYINVVELGPELYGVGPAALTYFAKTPQGLTDKEAAFLATLLPSPTSGHERAAQGRVSEARIERILENMRLAGLRSEDEIARARAQRLVLLLEPEG